MGDAATVAGVADLDDALQRGRVEAMGDVLHVLDDPDKDADVVGAPDPLIVGSSAVMARDVGERCPV
jgi:hypothetical protein